MPAMRPVSRDAHWFRRKILFVCFDVVALQVLVEQSLQSRLIRQANDRFDNFATFEK